MLILASRSPRRFELLSLLGIPFETVPADIEEIIDNSLCPQDQVISLAKQKAEHIFISHPDDTVIGADTLVFLEDIPLGKPCDDEDARRMLKMLSGKTHRAITGVCILARGENHVFSHTSHITFDDISPKILDWYISTGESMGCAGGYQIQNGASVFTKGIVGTISGTMGFPLDAISDCLGKMGLFPGN